MEIFRPNVPAPEIVKSEVPSRNIRRAIDQRLQSVIYGIYRFAAYDEIGV